MFLRFHSLDTYRAMNIVIEEDPSTNEGALWLGDYTAATDLMMLKQKNIRSVLTVASGLNVSYPAIANIIHKSYNILDIESANIKRIWSETYKWINDGLSRGSVLVHCAAGVSRSASTVIAFIMKRRNQNFTETFNFVKQRRPIIHPNYGFQRQLVQYQKELIHGNDLQQTQFSQKKQFNPELNFKTTQVESTVQKVQRIYQTDLPKTVKKGIPSANEKNPFINSSPQKQQLKSKNFYIGISDQGQLDNYHVQKSNNNNIFKTIPQKITLKSNNKYLFQNKK